MSFVSAVVAVYLGLPSHQDVKPNFLPFSTPQPPSLEEVVQHLEGQKGIQLFLRKYQQARKTPSHETSEQNEISKRIADLAALPYLRFVDAQSQNIIGKGKALVIDKSHQVVLMLLQWEMYDYFVPKFQWVGSHAMHFVRWFKARNRDNLAEGGFLTRLEQDDFFSAGCLAHQKSQYFWQALLQTSQMYSFARRNADSAHLVQPISREMQYCRDQYKKWNRRRLSLYQMSYIFLQVRQMQVALKLSLDLTDDAFKGVSRRARISFYEHWLNATQAAFYNRTMEEKGLSYFEWTGNKTLDVLDSIGTYLGLQEDSQKPPPFGDCLKTLEENLKEDQQDLKTVWAKLTCDPKSWDMDDWVLKPATAFEKKHEDKDKKVTPEGFLVQLLTIDQAVTAERLCHAMSNRIPAPFIWSQQLNLVQSYNQLLGKLFTSQKMIDVTFSRIVERTYANKDSVQEDELNLIHTQLQQCQGLSQDLYNGIICLKGSLLKSALGNFDQQNTGFSTRILKDVARTTFFIISEGALKTDLPDLDSMSFEVNKLLSHVTGTLNRVNGVVVDGFVVMQSSADKRDDAESQLPESMLGSWLKPGVSLATSGMDWLQQTVSSIKGSEAPTSTTRGASAQDKETDGNLLK